MIELWAKHIFLPQQTCLLIQKHRQLNWYWSNVSQLKNRFWAIGGSQLIPLHVTLGVYDCLCAWTFKQLFLFCTPNIVSNFWILVFRWWINEQWTQTYSFQHTHKIQHTPQKFHGNLYKRHILFQLTFLGTQSHDHICTILLLSTSKGKDRSIHATSLCCCQGK